MEDEYEKIFGNPGNVENDKLGYELTIEMNRNPKTKIAVFISVYSPTEENRKALKDAGMKVQRMHKDIIPGFEARGNSDALCKIKEFKWIKYISVNHECSIVD
jgi:hypothetical protein